ncbi:hypothetical protein [Thiolinea disciformis]|uniref:hypothetical protein n=1 Tax=Thiolinea disciformis TaxID=125614 RepID=UPI0003818FB4|nr:hypothetical protein [Thiolinea disciformis]
MMHWSEQYLGKRWTPEQDCYYWFSTIQRTQFGRSTPFVTGSEQEKALALIEHRIKVWRRVGIDQLQEGDAVLMRPTGRMGELHHIGVWCAANQGGVLHAPQNGTIQLDDWVSLQLSGWTVRECLTYA